MNLEEQISSVLNDPEAMSKLSSIVSALGAGGQQAQNEPQPLPQAQPQPQMQIPNLPDISGDNRTKLLMAIKPFLSEKRAPYVDGAVAILRMMKLGKLGKDLKLF